MKNGLGRHDASNVISRLVERNIFYPDTGVLRTGRRQPTVNAMRTRIVSGGRKDTITAVTLRHLAEIGSAKLNIALGVSQCVEAGIGQSNFLGNLFSCGRHQLHQPNRTGA